MNYTILRVMDHVEVYDRFHLFVFSADTIQEAEHEIRSLTESVRV